jgi:hypothetical protein
MAAAVAASGGGGGACASAGGGPRAAYCTLITSDDFLPGLQVLVFSLRSSGTRVPLVILHTSALSDHSIAKMRKFPGCVLRAVSDIPNPNHDVHVEGWVNSGCVCASVRACASVCERVRGWVCMRVCVRACVCVPACVRCYALCVCGTIAGTANSLYRHNDVTRWRSTTHRPQYAIITANNRSYTKLHIWNLVEFERVVYLDADTLVRIVMRRPVSLLYVLLQDDDFRHC